MYSDMSNQDSKMITIKRSVMSEKMFDAKYECESPERLSMTERIVNALKPKRTEPAAFLADLVFSIFPILQWLPRYQVKQWLLADVMSGFTVGIMQIPQGMTHRDVEI